jgi:hypothetical protein
MSNGFLRKIGHALSIFGVSNPDDVRKMQARKASAKAVRPAPAAVPNSTVVEQSDGETPGDSGGPSGDPRTPGQG